MNVKNSCTNQRRLNSDGQLYLKNCRQREKDRQKEEQAADLGVLIHHIRFKEHPTSFLSVSLPHFRFLAKLVLFIHPPHVDHHFHHHYTFIYSNRLDHQQQQQQHHHHHHHQLIHHNRYLDIFPFLGLVFFSIWFRQQRSLNIVI